MKIRLPSGDICLVYKDDLLKFGNRGWYIQQTTRHVITCIKGKQIAIHRLIMNAQKGQMVDHINGNTLDNRRSNLRFCNRSTNGMNRDAPANSKSGIKNIVLKDKYNKYEVHIMAEKKRYYFGSYADLEKAIQVRNEKLKLLHGEYARY